MFAVRAQSIRILAEKYRKKIYLNGIKILKKTGIPPFLMVFNSLFIYLLLFTKDLSPF